MSVASAHVARAVQEVSAGAGNPQHVATVVGAFMKAQPTVGHYVASHQRELGLEGVVLTLLHASVLARCIELDTGRRLRLTSAAELDAAARGDHSEAVFRKDEPALDGYLTDNIPTSDATIGGDKRPVALDLLRVIARTFIAQP
jgi:hypothetical protein